MEKSIETIWREGFLDNNALVAPKLNDLYNLKSKHLIDTLIRAGKLNLICIAVAAFAILVGSIFLGVPYEGAFFSMLLMVAVVYGVKQFEKLKLLDNSLNSYQYLKSFDKFMKDSMAAYTKMYRFMYPAFVLTGFQSMWIFYGSAERLIEEDPDIYLINGIPVPMLIGVLLFAGLMSLFAGPIYRLDVNLFYGRMFKKLHEILADMEELRR